MSEYTDPRFEGMVFTKRVGTRWLCIHLTDAQVRVWDWSADAMVDHWSTEEGAWARGDGIVYDDVVHTSKDGVALLLNEREVVEDMIYRLEQTIDDCIYSGDPDSRAEARAARAVLKKLKHAHI